VRRKKKEEKGTWCWDLLMNGWAGLGNNWASQAHQKKGMKL